MVENGGEWEDGMRWKHWPSQDDPRPHQWYFLPEILQEIMYILLPFRKSRWSF